MPVYWLDADVYIQAQNIYYPFDRVPGFWTYFAKQISHGLICSPKAVFDEVQRQEDRVADFMKARQSNGLCIQPPDGIYPWMTEIGDHIVATYSRHHAEEFLSGSDPLLIAYAKNDGGAVVTQESDSRKKKIRIPTVCKAFDIKCIDLFEMLDEMGASF